MLSHSILKNQTLKLETEPSVTFIWSSFKVKFNHLFLVILTSLKNVTLIKTQTQDAFASIVFIMN